MQARQTPTFELAKSYSSTDGDMAAALAEEFFGRPMAWQVYIINNLLARDENDRFINKSSALAVPRQNGKSWIIRSLCFYCLIAEGARILYTCQHSDTADEMFKALSAPFEDEDNAELNAMLKTVRKTNGQQAIYLKNGGFIRFSTRTNTLARGRSLDKIIYDEAQDLTSAQQAASLPTLATSDNAQVIYMGTPPNSESAGTIFAEMHDDAHSDDPNPIAWFEWAVSEVGDIRDKARWYETNPSLGVLIDESAIELELNMPDDDFARERLGWWVERKKINAYLIAKDEWEACATDDPPYGEADAFAIKFSPDGAVASLAVSVVDAGKAHVELVQKFDTSKGIREIVKIISARAEMVPFVIDGKAYSQTLINRVESIVPDGSVSLASTGDVIEASSAFLNEVREETLTWYSPDGACDDVLSQSVLTATKRNIGTSGGWGFDGCDTTPIEACALAAWAARKNADAAEDTMEVYF